MLIEDLNKRYGRTWQTEDIVCEINGIQQNLNEIDKIVEEIDMLVE
jgi:hypothetical protein